MGRRDWHAGVPTFKSILYRGLWPGIDLRFDGTAGKLEYSFVVHPGANPAAIKLAYRGSTEHVLTAAGGMRVSTTSYHRDRADVGSPWSHHGASDFPFDVNLLCINADATPAFAREAGTPRDCMENAES